jgi:hypothetical protein
VKTPTIVERTPEGARKLLVPGTKVDASQTASTSRAPWVDANGWRFLRSPDTAYVYEKVPAARLKLAAAEAAVYGGQAAIVGGEEAQREIEAVGSYLASIEDVSLPRVADVFVVDDGTPMVGEVLNLLSRRNLLWRAGDKPASAKLTVQIGSADFPRSQAANPSDFAQIVRRKLTDPKRSLRVYGSEVIMGHLLSDGQRARLHLLNYATDPIEAFRIRLLGQWKVERIRSFADPDARTEEFEYYDGGTEFGVDRVTLHCLVDLIRAS